jgi:osmotically-inducible protein OsmY
MKHKLSSLAISVLGAATLVTALGGCIPLMVGGAAIGTLVAVDRRTSGAQLEDEGIELRGASRVRDTVGSRARVNITSYNRQVLLTGEVLNDRDKQAIGDAISKLENVRAVVNELAVMNSPTLVQRSSDLLVTGKVKASLVDAKDLFAGAFKVVTERGTVYLMGRVSQREADRATQITRSISGVQKVVRIFEVVSEEELQRILQQQPLQRPAPAASAPRS